MYPQKRFTKRVKGSLKPSAAQLSKIKQENHNLSESSCDEVRGLSKGFL